jgi:hypothetical protein
MKIGHARVSTPDQHLDLQLKALKKAGCQKIFREKVSGANRNRPEFQRMLDQIRSGDMIIVWKLDCLARSTRDLLNTTETLSDTGANFHELLNKGKIGSRNRKLSMCMQRRFIAWFLSKRRLLPSQTVGNENDAIFIAKDNKATRPAHRFFFTGRLYPCLYDRDRHKRFQLVRCGVSKALSVLKSQRARAYPHTQTAACKLGQRCVRL